MLGASQESVEALKLDTESMEKEAGDIHSKMEALIEEKERQMGSELKSLSNTVDELSKGLVQATSNWTNQKVRIYDGVWRVAWSVECWFHRRWSGSLEQEGTCCSFSVSLGRIAATDRFGIVPIPKFATTSHPLGSRRSLLRDSRPQTWNSFDVQQSILPTAAKESSVASELLKQASLKQACSVLSSQLRCFTHPAERPVGVGLERRTR